ncbi:hypothetical protein PC116_g5422 [Phytophthora cactorum]|uniref:Uncharacterized protein n=1 Tax=Phytophthora cactorum TaxID=29920 RepID=A0A8T1EC93_9STRA|nr:hypothetical protein Pcac1_g7733 [Phytophthora cactorum]KAG2843014.1 hypothetical protein PC112_g2804 [Phytophthora cactorum]KAG2843880.1 hypothetical protein PC111_g2181 [Phytophthora cactorum]KAG2866030.1 hypothetical protein PC113_g3179 [Phytophthora cactorum]KAG2928432.1 hypothetical protein PC114_g3121 [Phytophthora cactorum]
MAFSMLGRFFFEALFAFALVFIVIAVVALGKTILHGLFDL